MEARQLSSKQRIDILLISSGEEIHTRLVQVCEKYHLKFQFVASVEDLKDRFHEVGVPTLVVMDLVDQKHLPEILEKIHLVQELSPKAELALLVADGLPAESFKKISAEGVSQVMAISEMLQTMRGDFFILDRFLLEYLPIDLGDLFPGTAMKFSAFHFLVLNNRYLPVIFQDFILSESKQKKLEKIKSVFIRKEQASDYQKYIETYYDSFSKGLMTRSKAAALPVLSAAVQARGLYLFGGPEDAEKLQSCFVAFEEAHNKLCTYLKSTETPLFSYYQLLSQNPASIFDRSLVLPGMAAFLAEISQAADPSLTLKAGFLAYLGLSQLKPDDYGRWKDIPDTSWAPEDKRIWVAQLKESADTATKKLSDIDQRIPQIIVSLYERQDGKGAPGEKAGEHILLESSFLHFTEKWVKYLAMSKIEEAPAFYGSLTEYLKEEGLAEPYLFEKIQETAFPKPGK